MSQPEPVDPPPGAAEALRDDSDRLFDALRELRELEQHKRTDPVTSPEFHEKARLVEEKAREVRELATEERLDGEVARKIEQAAPEDGARPQTLEDAG
ncbi:MAG: hypothetical protein ACJ77N_03075 [Chloroflexota bacterium]